MARPAKYKPDYHPQKVRELTKQAEQEGKYLIDEQIAILLGISESTFYTWKREFPEFLQAVEEGKQYRKKKLEDTAFKVATGYYEFEHEKDKKRKYYKPDSKVLCLMLYSLFGDKYKIKTENVNIDPLKKKIQDMTPEEVEARIKELEEKRKDEK